MDDTISRQAAIDAATIPPEWDGMYIQDLNGRIREAIEALPSAQPEYTEQDVRDAFNDGYRCDMESAQPDDEETNYWHEKANSYEQTLAKLTQNIAEQPEIIHCKDCKYAEVADPEDSQDGYTCQFHRGSIWFSGSYCSWAEREENG